MHRTSSRIPGNTTAKDSTNTSDLAAVLELSQITFAILHILVSGIVKSCLELTQITLGALLTICSRPALQDAVSHHPNKNQSHSQAGHAKGVLRHPDPLTQHPVRRISAGFLSDELPCAEPTVAESNVTVSNTAMPSLQSRSNIPTFRPQRPRSPRGGTPTKIPLPKASVATSYANINGAACIRGHEDENIPPGASNRRRSGLGLPASGTLDLTALHASKLKPPNFTKPKVRSLGNNLPKSRTLNVFSNLTSSISRASLVSSFTRSASGSSAAGSSEPSDPLSSPRDPGASFLNPRQIHQAQSPEYWTGRFVALQDKFLSEMMLPENLNSLVTAQAERSVLERHFPQPVNQHLYAARARGHRYSASTATAAGAKGRRVDEEQNAAYISTAALLEDDDNRAKRVFLHLEALCTTGEARRSLHAWQQSYARQVGKEILLPRGGSMEDRGWVERILGGGKRGSMDFGRGARRW